MATKVKETNSDSEEVKFVTKGRETSRDVHTSTASSRRRSLSRSRANDSEYDTDVETGTKPHRRVASPSSHEPVPMKVKPEKSSSSDERPVKEEKSPKKPLSPSKKKPTKTPNSSSNEEEPTVTTSPKKRIVIRSTSASSSSRSSSPESSSEEEKPKKTSSKKSKKSSSPSNSSEEEKSKKASNKKKKASSKKSKKSSSSASSSEEEKSKKGSRKKASSPKKTMDMEEVRSRYTVKIGKKFKNFKMSEIQEKHFAIMKGIITKNKYALDTSEKGAGKTYTGIAMINAFLNGELSEEDVKPKYVIYITFKANLPKVKKTLDEYGIKDSIVISFEGMRSQTVSEKGGKILPHGLLHREDKRGDTTFELTKLAKKMIKEGCLLIMDEVQALKNNNLQYRAARTLEHTIITTENPSLVLEMSNTPAGDIEHFMNIMYRFDLIHEYDVKVNGKESKKLVLYTAQFGDYKPYGILDIIRAARDFDKGETIKVLAKHEVRFRTGKEDDDEIKVKGLNKDNTKDLGYELYEKVIVEHISHAMPAPEGREGVKVTVTNSFLRASDEDYKLIKKEINGLIEITKYDPVTKTFDVSEGKVPITAIGKPIQRIEASMSNIFIRKTREVLDENENSKVVIALTRKNNIRNIAGVLKKYGVLIVWGKDPKTGKTYKAEDRQEIIDKFNRADTKYRVLIGIMSAISTGVDLDDKDGRFPRTALAFPPFSFFAANQFTGRFLRGQTTASSTNIMFVYPENRQGNLYGTAMINILERYTKRSERSENTTYMGKEIGTKKNSGGHPKVNEADDFEIKNGPLDIKSILDDIGYDKNKDSDEEDLEEAERIALEEMGLESDKKAKKPTRKKKSSASSASEKKKKKSTKKKAHSPSEESSSEKPKKRSTKKKASKKKAHSSSEEESSN